MSLAAILAQHGIAEPLEVVLAAGPLEGFCVSGENAIAVWQALRALVPATRRWPVLLGDDEQRARAAEIFRVDAPSTARCLAAAAEQYAEMLEWGDKAARALPDVGAVLAQIVGSGPQPFAEVLRRIDGAPAIAAPDEARPMRRGHGPSTPELRLPRAERVYVALVPAEHGWQVPAQLELGWEYVSGSQLCSHLRRLDDLFGAELVGLTHDLVELAVARPPETIERAQQMATLLLGADEGTDAASLVHSPSVSLWWD